MFYNAFGNFEIGVINENNYVYDIETGETKKISFDEYAVNGSYNNFNARFQ
jgi:hypothetical protein